MPEAGSGSKVRYCRQMITTALPGIHHAGLQDSPYSLSCGTEVHGAAMRSSYVTETLVQSMVSLRATMHYFSSHELSFLGIIQIHHYALISNQFGVTSGIRTDPTRYRCTDTQIEPAGGKRLKS